MNPNFVIPSENQEQNGYLGEKISILHKQMTEKLSFEVNLRNCQKSEKKCIFLDQKYFEPQFFLSQVKNKSKMVIWVKKLASYINK